MTPDLVRELALRALDDADALPVLGDAVLESGWCEPRVIWMLNASPKKLWRRWLQAAAKPTTAWARAIAACALFENLPRLFGDAFVRSKLPPPTLASVMSVLRRHYPAQRIPELSFSSPLFAGVNREANPPRLRSDTVATVARESSGTYTVTFPPTWGRR